MVLWKMGERKMYKNGWVTHPLAYAQGDSAPGCVCVWSQLHHGWSLRSFSLRALIFPLFLCVLFLSALSNIASGSLSPLSFQQKLTAFGFTSQEYWLLFSASAIFQPISHLPRSFSLYYFFRAFLSALSQICMHSKGMFRCCSLEASKQQIRKFFLSFPPILVKCNDL